MASLRVLVSPLEMWGEDAGVQEDNWGCGGGLVEDPQLSANLPPPNSGLLPPDDELPKDVKQEEYTEDSMMTDLFLDTDTGSEDPSPGYQGSNTDTSDLTNVITEGHRQAGSTESESTHTGELPFTCKECRATFSRIDSLK